MEPLNPPDSHCLRAAQGWLELGSIRSAAGEVARLSAAGKKHPEALAVRWELAECNHDWNEALAVATLAVELASDTPGPWIQRSYALHELKRTAEAFEKLRPVAERFPTVATIAYNLACYCCQLGRREEAHAWYGRARAAGEPARLRQLAMSDPDSAPMRDEIEKL